MSVLWWVYLVYLVYPPSLWYTHSPDIPTPWKAPETRDTHPSKGPGTGIPTSERNMEPDIPIPSPVDRHRLVKTLPSRNFLGGRYKSRRIEWSRSQRFSRHKHPHRWRGMSKYKLPKIPQRDNCSKTQL